METQEDAEPCRSTTQHNTTAATITTTTKTTATTKDTHTSTAEERFLLALIAVIRLHAFALAGLACLGIYVVIYSMLIMKPDVEFELYHQDIEQKDFAGLAIGWTLTNLYLGIFPFILLANVYGFENVKFLIPVNVFLLVLTAAIAIVHFISEPLYDATSSIYGVGLYALHIIQFVVNFWLFGRRYGQTKKIFLAFGLGLALVYLIGVLFDFWILVEYFYMSLGLQFFVRNMLCPALFLLMIWITSRFSKDLPVVKAQKPAKSIEVAVSENEDDIQLKNSTSTISITASTDQMLPTKNENSETPQSEPIKKGFVICFLPFVAREFFVRMLYIQIPYLSVVAYSQAIMVVTDFVFKLIFWNRAIIASYFAPYLIDHKRYARLFGKPAGDEYYAMILYFEKIATVTAIFFGTSLGLFYRHLFEDGRDIAFPFYSFLIQYGMVIIGHIATVYFEIFFNIPVVKISQRPINKQNFKALLAVTFFMADIGLWRSFYFLTGKYVYF